ncbi:MAG TPA: nucleoside-diphosphate sugar epimerase [Bacilli bacterium]
MEDKITAIVQSLSDSQRHISGILHAGKDIAAHMSGIVQAIPDADFTFNGFGEISAAATSVNANVVSYLNSLAGLENAIADHLSAIMHELNGGEEE